MTIIAGVIFLSGAVLVIVGVNVLFGLGGTLIGLGVLAMLIAYGVANSE